MVITTKALSEENWPTADIVMPILDNLKAKFTTIEEDFPFVIELKNSVLNDVKSFPK